MLRARVVGVGSYLPPRVVTNKDLEKIMDTSDEWIVRRSGIQERRWSDVGVSTSDLGVQAAERAIENAGIKKTEIDLIIFATLSPDHFFPGTGCFLQAKLGIKNTPTLDIRQQCSGFIYGLSVADQFIRTGMYKHVLLVGAETHSSGLQKATPGRDVSVLFGDGAGAVVLSATDVTLPSTDSFIYSTHLHTDGSGAKELWTPAPGAGMGKSERVDAQMLEEGLHYPVMNGKKVFVEAVTKMGEVLQEGLAHNALKSEDIDLFLFHQANLRINEAVADFFKIPKEKVFNTIEKFGNTTAATIPLGMDEAIKAGRLKKGMRVAMAAFGSGFTWASAILRF